MSSSVKGIERLGDTLSESQGEEAHIWGKVVGPRLKGIYASEGLKGTLETKNIDEEVHA